MTQKKFWALGLVAALVAAIVGILVPAANAASNPPWEPDSQSVGTLTFYDAAGNVVTHGNDLSNAFAYVAANSANPDRPGTTKAYISYAFPTHGEVPADWFNTSSLGATAFPVTTAPAPVNGLTNPVSSAAVTGSNNLNNAIGQGNFDPTTGYDDILEVRLGDTGGGFTPDSSVYWNADIQIDPTMGTWTQIYPAVAGPTVTTTTVTALPASPQAPSANITFTATVSPSAAAGTVQFFEDGTALGTATDVNAGTATLATTGTDLGSGAHQITATFTPSDTSAYSGSTSAALPYTISGTTQQAAGTFVPVSPTRLLDTRNNIGSGGPVAAGATVHLAVTGGVVPTGASAVVLNVTVTQPAASGNVVVYPDGGAKPGSSNLNFLKGQTIPNLVIVGVGSDGKVALTNNGTGTVQLVADVSGYYVGGTPADPGTLKAVTPTRLLDTRSNLGATGPVTAGATVHLAVTGGVVPTGASAVVLNVTVTQPAASGNVVVYPDGGSKPASSNLNFLAGQTIPNLVVVGVGSDGKVALTNNGTGTVQLVADVSGYFLGGGTPTDTGAFVPVAPARLLDTRNTIGAGGPVAAGATVHLAVTGGVVPTGASAVVLNVTVTQPAASGNVVVYPDGGAKPGSSNLNFLKGQTIPNLVIVGVGSDGKVALTNNGTGTVQLVADVSGYYLGASA